jgi:hypothetical protein
LERIAEVKGDAVISGLHPGTGNSQIPLWAEGSNVVFKDGGVKPAPLQSLVFNKGTGLLGNGVRTIDNDGAEALVWGDRENLYRGVDAPTSINATRGNTDWLGLDSDSANWLGVSTNVTDDAEDAPGGSGGCLELYGTSASQIMQAWRSNAAPMPAPYDFTGKVLTVWVQVPTNNTQDDLSTGGDAIRIKLGSTAMSPGTNYGEYYFSGELIPEHDTWYKIELDLRTEEPNDTDGGLDLSSVSLISLGLKLNRNAQAVDIVLFDHMQIKGNYTGTDLDTWSIVQFGQSVLASNGVDEVQYLADITTGVFQDLSDAGGDLAASFRANILQKLGPYIIAFNTDNDNTEARWCTEDNVLVWSPLATNSARDIQIRDMNSSIKCVIEFGTALLVIGETRAHIFQFIGAPFFFGAKKIIDGIGAVGKNAVCESGKMIYGFSAHGIYITDGMIKEYIDEPDIHSFIYEDDNKYDKTRAALVCAWEDTNDDEVYFSYPTIDGSGFTVSVNRKTGVWSMHDYWRTAASPGELWKAAIILSEDGDVFIQDASGTGSSYDVNPLGLSDMLVIDIGMGDAAMGQQPYGGKNTID